MEEILKLLKVASDITDNSNEVKKGGIFFAVRGLKFDGHNFIGEVLKKEPLAAVVEKDFNPKGFDFKNTKLVKVKNTRRAFALSCREFYGRPDEKIKLFGVTGTNGKTSTTYILSSLLSKLGVPCGIVGTVEYRFKGRVYGKGQTTPHPKIWFKTLSNMAKNGAEAVACEVSSHALDQDRIFGTKFEGLIFTNLSRDHLDYHGSMEDYFNSKRRLFNEYSYKSAVVNGDNFYGLRLKREFKFPSFGFSEINEYRILKTSLSLEGSSFELRTPGGEIFKVETNLLGGFQILNLTGALALLHSLGFDMEKLVQFSKELPQIPGRFELVFSGPFTVVVDYAHTPDALEKLLISAKRLNPKRIITVFGAGGNRDKSKRPLMGKIAEKYSDFVIVTSDNPRWERPESIAEEILSGIGDKSKTLTVIDRKEAIEAALKMAREGDLVIVAGKGHEDYQEIEGKRYPFDDRKVVGEVLKILGYIP